MLLRWSFRALVCALSLSVSSGCADPNPSPISGREDPAGDEPRTTPPEESWEESWDDLESLFAPAAIEWSFTELQGSWGDLHLHAKVFAMAEQPLEAEVLAFTLTPGVDEDIETELPLWSGELVPGEPLQLSVPTESLPALTPGLPIELRIVAHIYDAEGAELNLPSVPRIVVLEPDQETVTVGPRQPYASAEEALRDASRAYLGSPFLESARSPDFADSPRNARGPDDLDVTARICPDWRVHYLDNQGATLINAAGEQRIPASYAWLEVTTPWDPLSGEPMGTFVDGAWLGPDGCVDMTLPAGPYVMAVHTRLMRDGQAIDVEGTHTNPRAPDPPEHFDPSYGVAAFRVTGPGPIHRLTRNNDRVVRATAVLSEALVHPDLPYFGSAPLNVYAHARCRTWNSAACASDTQIHLGDSYNLQDTTERRNLIAHEFGHAIQYRGIGRFAADYEATDDLELPGTCTCEHIEPATSHCLQSLEDNGVAFAEGFAHFVAARLYNADPSGCEFQYYKPLWLAPAIVGEPLRYTATCNTPVVWEETQDCSHDGSSTEYDWLTFLWSINRGDPVGRWSVLEIFDVLRASCGGTSCRSDPLDWTSIVSRAWLRDDEHRVRFVSAGALHGVME